MIEALSGASAFVLPDGPWPTLLDALCASFGSVSAEVWRERFARGRILADIGRLSRFGRLAASTGAYAVVEVGEFAPVSEIVRTFSDFHLRRRVVAVELDSPPAVALARLNGAASPPPVGVGARGRSSSVIAVTPFCV